MVTLVLENSPTEKLTSLAFSHSFQFWPPRKPSAGKAAVQLLGVHDEDFLYPQGKAESWEGFKIHKNVVLETTCHRTEIIQD